MMGETGRWEARAPLSRGKSEARETAEGGGGGDGICDEGQMVEIIVLEKELNPTTALDS